MLDAEKIIRKITFQQINDSTFQKIIVNKYLVLLVIHLTSDLYPFTSKASVKAFPTNIKVITKSIIANPGIMAKKGLPKTI